MTEDEAKTKWCPFARSHGVAGLDYPVTINRWDGPINDCLCIASACMAWRSKETAEFTTTAEAEFRKTGQRLISVTGHCGLAGTP